MQTNFDTLRRVRQATIEAWSAAWDGEPIPHDIVIAGGAVRSLLLGKPVRDIDVFVSLADCGGLSEGAMEDFLHNLAWELNGRSLPTTAELRKDGLAGKAYSFVASVCSVEKDTDYGEILSGVIKFAGWTEVQVIFIPRSTAAHIAGFPCPLSQAWLGESGRPQVSAAFRHDAAHRILRYAPVKGSYNSRNHDKYMAKLAGYFSDWKHVNFAALPKSEKLGCIEALPAAAAATTKPTAEQLKAADKAFHILMDKGVLRI